MKTSYTPHHGLVIASPTCLLEGIKAVSLTPSGFPYPHILKFEDLIFNHRFPFQLAGMIWRFDDTFFC